MTPDKKSICKHCKKPTEEYSINELLKCSLAIGKEGQSDPTETEWLEYFNEIKGGELSRMWERQKNSDSKN